MKHESNKSCAVECYTTTLKSTSDCLGRRKSIKYSCITTCINIIKTELGTYNTCVECYVMCNCRRILILGLVAVV